MVSTQRGAARAASLLRARTVLALVIGSLAPFVGCLNPRPEELPSAERAAPDPAPAGEAGGDNPLLIDGPPPGNGNAPEEEGPSNGLVDAPGVDAGDRGATDAGAGAPDSGAL